MKRSRLYLVLALLLAALGVWQVGEAGYMHAKALLAQHLLEESWADTVSTGKPVKPWPWADTAPVARLRVPSLDQDMIVLAGGSGRTMAFAPGHVDGTPLPGEAGLSVIGVQRDAQIITDLPADQRLARDSTLIAVGSPEQRERFGVVYE